MTLVSVAGLGRSASTWHPCGPHEDHVIGACRFTLAAHHPQQLYQAARRLVSAPTAAVSATAHWSRCAAGPRHGWTQAEM